jgi:hypothetical protein
MKRDCALKIATFKKKLKDIDEKKINYNTEYEAAVENRKINSEIVILDVLKDTAKLILNAFYGSCIVNVDKFSSVEICDTINKPARVKKLVSLR